MDYWAANWFEFGKGVASKTLIVWGNTDSCSRIEKLWESEQIDTGWHRYTAILTPQQKDYEYIHFRIGLSDSNSRYLSLDALSDIYPFNANDVTATIKDTTFTKPNTTCIELNATANITTYDTVYWQDAVGNKIADGFNGGTVCPDASTYYIIAMRDSVPDCAGIWWSYDTVKVTVNTGTAVLSPEVYPDFFGRGGWGRIFPNPATNTLTLQLSAQPSTLNSQFTFSIQNTIGQTLLTAPIYDQQMTIDVSSLPNGVYIFTLYQSNKILKYEKLIK